MTFMCDGLILVFGTKAWMSLLLLIVANLLIHKLEPVCYHLVMVGSKGKKSL